MTDVAIVHDVLAARAGGERVALALAQGFPDAPLYSLIHEPAATFDFGQVDTSWLDRIGPLRTRYRAALPVAALTFAATHIEAAVTICSTSGLSHHVRCHGVKLVYCHTPARWLHAPEVYMRGFGAATTLAARALRPTFKKFDEFAMRGADGIVVNSKQIASEVNAIYGREAQVVAPCSTLDIEGSTRPIANIDPGFVLSPARALGYKRLDVLLGAARALPHRSFVHVGDGPLRGEILRCAPSNFISVGAVDDDQLRWAYRHAAVVALTCAEDYGLVPLEASAHGLTTVAPNARGLVDHTQDMMLSYEFGSVTGLSTAIEAAPEPTGKHRPERLGRERFIASIRDAVDDLR